ncbi:AbrB family transcriptional regulator [Xanthobacter sediminis]
MRGPSSATIRAAYGAVLTLAAGALGGLVFSALGLPAAWISGALVFTMGLAVAGRPVVVPEWVRFLAYTVLGTSMGTVLTPDMLARAGSWPLSMACLGASVIGTMAGSAWFLMRFGGWSLETAFYASAPGAFSTVVAMAEETPADLRKVAFAQTLRLFLLVAALPNVLGATGLADGGFQPKPHVAPMLDVAILFVVSAAGGLTASALKVPGGLILGALAGSAALHLGGWSSAAVPQSLQLPAFVVLGAGVGARFIGTSLSAIRSYFWVSLGAFLVAIAVATAFALLASWLTGDDLGKLLTAFSPGALEAMTALGFAMGYDPAFMSAHHLFRFAGLSVALPVAAHLLFRAEQAGRADDQAP